MLYRFLLAAFVGLLLTAAAAVVLAKAPQPNNAICCRDERLTEPVLRAARSGDVAALRKLLKSHPKLIGLNLEFHGCIGRKLTPLHAAVEKGQIAAAKFLVSKGAKVNARDNSGSTPLHDAATPEMASFLLSKGADIEAKDNRGHTPLHTAAESRRSKVAAFLRSKGARVANIFDAVLVGDAALVRGMLDSKPGLVKAAEQDGTTPLCYAASTGQVEMARLLLDRGAPVTSAKFSADPLYAAVDVNQVGTARLLLENGANPNASTGFMGSLLSQTAYYNHLDMARLLIAHGADINTGNEAFELPPLHSAVFRGNDKMAELLISNGADVRKKIDDGRTPLHFAASADDEGRCVSVLLARGADFNAKDNRGLTPLSYSASRATVWVLLDHGAKVNSAADAALAGNAGKLLEYVRADPSVLKATAAFGHRNLLHLAAIGGSATVTEILIKRGIKVNVPDVNGETPLHFAAQKGNSEVVRVLLDYGASVNARAMDRVGAGTPLQYALEAGQKDTADLLRRRGGRH